LTIDMSFKIAQTLTGNFVFLAIEPRRRKRKQQQQRQD